MKNTRHLCSDKHFVSYVILWVPIVSGHFEHFFPNIHFLHFCKIFSVVDIYHYFYIRLNTATTVIYRVKHNQTGIYSLSSSDDSADDSEPASKRRISASLPHESASNKKERHIPEIIGDRVHRSKCRRSACNAQTTVSCSSCKVLVVVSKGQEIA